jgi:hypothetical protein
MWMRTTGLMLGTALLVGAPAHAASQTILGKKLIIKDAGSPTTRKIVASAKEFSSPDTVVGDPVANGGSLRVVAYGGTPSDETFALPAAGWKAIGTTGFKFLGTLVPGQPVKKVIIKKAPSGVFLVKAIVKGTFGPINTVPPSPGTDGGIMLTLGGGDTYCVGYGGPLAGGTVINTATAFKVINPTSESCPGAGACPPTVARAKVITQPNELIDGEMSRGELGDVLLYNDEVQVVIQKPGRVMFGIGPYGGNIIDADLQRCDVGERDQFEEMAPLINIENTANYTSVVVLNDGSNGAPAVVRATGPDDLLDYINPSSTVASFGAAFPPAADDTDLPIDVQTDYILEAGKPYVRVETTITNLSPNPVPFYFGDVLNGSGEIEQFQPSYGFGEPLITDICPVSTWQPCTLLGSGSCDPCSYLAYAGHDGGSGVSYGYFHDLDTRNIANNPIGTTAFSTSGVAVPLIGQRVAFTLIGATQPNFQVAAAGNPGDSRTIRRYFAVGDGSAGSIMNIRAGVQGFTTLGTVQGTVTSGGSPLPDAQVTVLGAPYAGGPVMNVVTQFRTAADGTYAGQLLAGNYDIRINKDGHEVASPDPASIVVTAGNTTTQDFTVPEAGTVVVNVTDENNQPIPAKVQLVGFDPSPNPANTQTVLIVNVSAGVFDDFEDELQYGIAAVAFADRTGTTGQFPVEPGTYQLAVSHGPRYSAAQQNVVVTAGATTTVNVQLAKVLDTSGFIASDYHVHAINSPDAQVPNADRVATMLAEGMDFFTPSDHDFRTDFETVVNAMGVSDILATAQSAEITTFDYGHFNSWPVTRDPLQLNGGGVDFGRAGIAPGMDFPAFGSFNLRPEEIFATAHADPRANLIQVNHMRSHFNLDGLGIDTAQTPPQSTVPGAARRLDPAIPNYFSPDFDALEVWIGTDGRSGDLQTFVGENLGDWFNMLNQGILRSGVADSDTHQKRTTQMNARTFVASAVTDPMLLHVDANQDAVAANIVAGRSIGTNGPFMRIQADAASTGESASLDDGASTMVSTTDGAVTITLDIQSPTWAEFDKVQFFTNAKPQPFGATTPPRYRALANNACSPASGCIEKVAGVDFTVNTVNVAPSVPGGDRLEATVVLNLTGLTQDTWVVALVRGTDGVSRPLFPIIPNSLKHAGNTTLADLTDGNVGEDGVVALAFTNPIYIDADDDDVFTPPGVMLTPP